MSNGKQAVIYARVSSVAQLQKGDGLSSQETRCREHAKYRGYEVVEVFRDNMSGGAADRPAMRALLTFLQKQRKETVVLIDDINRFSRDVQVHWQLRALLAEAGGKLESPSLQFGDDSDSVLVENLLASVSQHQRQKNGEQTKNRMRARAMNGYWVFHAPVGMKYEKTSGHGKLLVRDEPNASYIQEALEGFATGRFETQGEVKRFLEGCPEFPKNGRGEVRYEEVIRLMRRPHYAGYIEIPEWNVPLRKGHHEGLISFETWNAIQDRLLGAERARAPVRQDINEDFPLRGFVTCHDCGNQLTASWSKSKTGKRHPYYMCFTKGCDSYRKSIRRDVLEGEFVDLLRDMQPSENLYKLAKAMFKSAWDQRVAQAQAACLTFKRDVAKLEKQIDGLLDRIVEASTPSVVSAYEKRLAKLEREKLVMQEKLAQGPKPKASFDELFELACTFLANPWKIWESGQLTLRRTVLKLAFADRISYCRKTGLRTPKTTLPFKVLEAMNAKKCSMAGRQGFEPWGRSHAQRFSRPPHSTTLPPPRCGSGAGCKTRGPRWQEGARAALGISCRRAPSALPMHAHAVYHRARVQAQPKTTKQSVQDAGKRARGTHETARSESWDRAAAPVCRGGRGAAGRLRKRAADAWPDHRPARPRHRATRTGHRADHHPTCRTRCRGTGDFPGGRGGPMGRAPVAGRGLGRAPGCERTRTGDHPQHGKRPLCDRGAVPQGTRYSRPAYSGLLRCRRRAGNARRCAGAVDRDRAAPRGSRRHAAQPD